MTATVERRDGSIGREPAISERHRGGETWPNLPWRARRHPLLAPLALDLSHTVSRSTGAAFIHGAREVALELRLIVAYGLIALIAVSGSIFALVYSKRRAERRRRLRGIKDYAPIDR